MSFDHPQALWLLALGVPVVLLHFVRGALRRMAVPTLLFWEQVLAEEERRTALKRLRHYASLLLNLAALAALAAAAAGPRLRGFSPTPARYALIFDSSAAMGAREADGRTRLAAALERGREFVSSRAPGDQVSLHDSSGPRVPFTSDLEKTARGMFSSLPAPRAELRVRVCEAVAAGDDVTAILYTDRPLSGVEDLTAAGRLRLVRLGGPRDNAGWTSGLPVRRAGEKRVTLFLTAGNFSSTPAARQAVLLFNGAELERRALDLAPGTQPVEGPVDPARHPGRKVEEGGLVDVALEPRDALPADDVASFVLPPAPPAVIVFHPGKPDEFLMKALQVLSEDGIAGRLGEAPAERYASVRGRLGEGTIAVFDRVAPPAPPAAGAFLILGAPGKGAPVERPAVADWDRDAPPNRLVDYAGLEVRRSRLLEGAALLRAEGGPLAVWSSRGGRAVVELGFALGESDLALRPAFPMLLRNFIEWGAFQGTRSFRTMYGVGEPLRPEKPLWVEDGLLVFARANGVERVPARQGWPVSAPRAGPGFVRVSAAGRSEWAAVNLFDAGESDLRAPAFPSAPLPPPAPWRARVPLATWAAGAALAILLAEWWLYHRGLI